jgi:hypothetical protein
MLRKMNRPPSRRGHALDPDADLGRVTWLLVAGLRHHGCDDARIRAEIQDAIKEALEGDKPWRATSDLPGLQPDEREIVSTAGAYRLVFDKFGLDRTDQRAQERWLALVQRQLDKALRAG